MAITPIERRALIDVHQPDLTPAIYQLLFTEEIKGNDLIYELRPWDNEGVPEYEDRVWAERLARGPHNCFHDDEAMKKFCDNPCTYQEAQAEFKAWLLERGVKEDEEILAKIWW